MYREDDILQEKADQAQITEYYVEAREKDRAGWQVFK
jgi:hypothetical protein